MRRSRFEIIKDILEAGKESSTKTSIVYEANLSFEQAEKYLNMLEKDELVNSHRSKHKKYETTNKGRKFLESFQELESLLTVAANTKSR